VQSPDGMPLRESDFDLSPTGPFQLPLSFGVVPLNHDARRRVRIIAQARTSSGQVLVQRSALTGFLPDTILRLPLFLPNVCRGLECPTGTTCRGDAPVCVTDEVRTSDLAPLTPRPDRGEFDGGYDLPFVDGASFAPDASTDAADARSDTSIDRSVDGMTDSGPDYLPIPNDCAYPDGANGMRVMIPTNAPRLIAPLSLGHVTSLQPTLRWERPAGADAVRIELCADRACTRVIQSLENVTELSARPAMPLPAGRVVFWRALPLTSGMVSGPWSAVWYFITPHSELGTDTSFQAQTDFNGDGFADVVYLETQLIIAASGLPGYIYHGGALGLCYRAQSRWYVADRASTVGGDPYDTSIYEITGSGDINGDGFGDLISSTSASRSPRGFLTVRYGSPAGLDFASGRLTSVSSPANAYGFGTRVRIIGDVNQDGYADVAVSATSVGGITNSGGVFVYLGSADGLNTTPAITILGATGEALGVDIAGGGADFDGDGYHDLAMARRGTMPGIVIRRGTPSGLAAMDEDVTRNVTGSLATLTSLSAADINGDGLSDLAYLTAGES